MSIFCFYLYYFDAIDYFKCYVQSFKVQGSCYLDLNYWISIASNCCLTTFIGLPSTQFVLKFCISMTFCNSWPISEASNSPGRYLKKLKSGCRSKLMNRTPFQCCNLIVLIYEKLKTSITIKFSIFWMNINNKSIKDQFEIKPLLLRSSVLYWRTVQNSTFDSIFGSGLVIWFNTSTYILSSIP